MIADLKPYPEYKESGLPWIDKGLDERNLWHMCRFYRAFQILNVVRTELGWTHYRCCEVLLYTPDVWIKEDSTKIGYEISFTWHFYKPQPLHTLDEIRANILALERETEGLLGEITGVVAT